LAHEACRQGFDVLFGNTHELLQPLHGGRADGMWAKGLRGELRPPLLVLDDGGLKPLVDPAPSDHFDVMNERDEVGSRPVTSNRAPTQWPDFLGNSLLASASRSRSTRKGRTASFTISYPPGYPWACSSWKMRYPL
jgi:DNA replication protein DnaC